jgi:hypothetical protein
MIEGHLAGPDLVECHFYERTKSEDGKGIRYKGLTIKSVPSHQLGIITTHPPIVGDLLWLEVVVYGPEPDEMPTGEIRSAEFRVIKRAWRYAGYGSDHFPFAARRQQTPIWLDVVVVEDDPIFADESPLPVDAEDIQPS